MEFTQPDFNLIPCVKYHKGEEEYKEFIYKMNPQQLDAACNQDEDMPQLPSDYE